MHQAILVHPQVDKCSEGRHVADRAFEHHAFFQIGNVLHTVVKPGDLEIRTRIAPRFFQLGQDVLDGNHTKFFVGKQLWTQRLQHVGATHHLSHGLARFGNDLLHHRVSLRMHPGHVQRVGTTPNTQKSRALLKGLGTQSGDFHQVLAAGERAIGFAPSHHRLCHRGRQARHPGQQRHAGGIEVHAHRVHAVFHHRVQGFCQFALIYVVLVLAHADAFGVNLDQLGQRVLQAAGDAGRAAQAHVHIRHFLRSKFASAVHRGACFGHHYLGEVAGWQRVLRR